MNELQFIQYKYQLRIREKQSAKSLWLSTYCCFVYMLIKAFNVSGKMVMIQIYCFLSSNSFPNDTDPYYMSLANLQWFCYEIASPISLPFLAKILINSQFKMVLLISSLGSLILIGPLQYDTLCKINNTCNEFMIIFLTILLSLIAGFCKTILLFTMLYYLSNLASGKEKILQYGAFYFIHQFQWIVGSLIGNILVHYGAKGNALETLNRLYIILIVGSGFLCLLFFTLPKEKKKSRFKKFKNCINQIVTEKSDTYKELKEQLLDFREKNLNLQNELIQKERQVQQLNFVTIQCFSFEDEELQEILQFDEQSQSSTNNSISINEYAKNTYYQNIGLTFMILLQDGFLHFIILLFNASCLLSYILIELPALIVDVNSVETPQQSAALIYEGFLYVGIGQVFGCFFIGLFGDFSQKISGLYYLLVAYQNGCVITWFVWGYKLNYLINFVALIFGFCSSGMTSTIISFLMLKYQKLIYTVDLMYIIFSLSFAFQSLLYLISNFKGIFSGLLILQITGLFGLYSTWKVHTYLRFKQN